MQRSAASASVHALEGGAHGFVPGLLGRRRSKPTKAVLEQRVLAAPPPGVTWMHVRVRANGGVVRAQRAKKSGAIRIADGLVRYQAGRHYIVNYGDRRAVVRREVFERVYLPVSQGVYKKRPEISYRYFTLPYDAAIMTADGPVRAKAGDWIMEGVEGDFVPDDAGSGARTLSNRLSRAWLRRSR